MPRKPTTPLTTPTNVTTATLPTPAPEPVTDPFAALQAYPANLFTPTRRQKPVSPKILELARYLVTAGKVPVSTAGWTPDMVKKFGTQIRSLKDMYGGRRVMLRAGTLANNEPGLLVSLGNPPTEPAPTA